MMMVIIFFMRCKISYDIDSILFIHVHVSMHMSSQKYFFKKKSFWFFAKKETYRNNDKVTIKREMYNFSWLLHFHACTCSVFHFWMVSSFPDKSIHLQWFHVGQESCRKKTCSVFCRIKRFISKGCKGNPFICCVVTYEHIQGSHRSCFFTRLRNALPICFPLCYPLSSGQNSDGKWIRKWAY